MNDAYLAQPARDRRARSLAWLVCTLLSIPAVVVVLLAYQWSLAWFDPEGIRIPGWLQNVGGFGCFAGVYLGAGYLTARWINRRFPDTPVASASWNGKD